MPEPSTSSSDSSASTSGPSESNSESPSDHETQDNSKQDDAPSQSGERENLGLREETPPDSHQNLLSTTKNETLSNDTTSGKGDLTNKNEDKNYTTPVEEGKERIETKSHNKEDQSVSSTKDDEETKTSPEEKSSKPSPAVPSSSEPKSPTKKPTVGITVFNDNIRKPRRTYTQRVSRSKRYKTRRNSTLVSTSDTPSIDPKIPPSTQPPKPSLQPPESPPPLPEPPPQPPESPPEPQPEPQPSESPSSSSTETPDATATETGTTSPTTTAPETEEKKEETKKKVIEKVRLIVCNREFWGARKTLYDIHGDECFIKLPAIEVTFVTNTEIDSCTTDDECNYRVRQLQRHHMDVLGHKDIVYNWLIGGNLEVFEGLGWDCRSPMVQDRRINRKLGHNILFGFIGRYSPEEIPTEMLNRALAFLHLNIEKNNIKDGYRTFVRYLLKLPGDLGSMYT